MLEDLGALYMMTYWEASAKLPLRLMLYYAIEGKYFGEHASGVGLRTGVDILGAGKNALKIKEKVFRRKAV